MPKLKVLSGPEVIKIFSSFGFVVVSQKGSHVKLRRSLSDTKQTLLIPNPKEIDKGTLAKIIEQSSRYISLEDLKKEFYN